MLQDLCTIGINGKTSGGLNTSASNCSSKSADVDQSKDMVANDIRAALCSL